MLDFMKRLLFGLLLAPVGLVQALETSHILTAEQWAVPRNVDGQAVDNTPVSGGNSPVSTGSVIGLQLDHMKNGAPSG